MSEDFDPEAAAPEPFMLEGQNADGLPKWLTYPCQRPGAEGDRCRVSINGQRNGSGASWNVTGASGENAAGPIESPTVNPSVHCVGMCHFHIRAGRFEHCGDYPRRP